MPLTGRATTATDEPVEIVRVHLFVADARKRAPVANERFMA